MVAMTGATDNVGFVETSGVFTSRVDKAAIVREVCYLSGTAPHVHSSQL